jgi:glucose/arabinose dehydrogenase
MPFLIVLFFAFAAGVAVPAATAEITNAPAAKTTNLILKIETKATRLYHPWGLAFLPDGRPLLTERAGRLRILGTNGKLSKPLQGVPTVFTSEQGGLLDVALAPDFAASGLIYFSYAEPRGGRKSNGTTVARAKLVLEGEGGRLQDLQVVFRQEPAYTGYLAFGSRVLFMPDGSLFITLGEREELEEQAQNPANHLGKLVRVLPDGRPHPDSPKLDGWRPEIWSIGHRNMQGIALNPTNGRVWTVEHGPRGGDEINVPLAGRNYGWPVISYGVHYDGRKIGEGTHKPGLEQPVYYWDPSIAPSSLMFYTGDLFPEWKGNLFVTALAGEALHRLVLDGEKVTGEEILLKEVDSRLRNVRQGPDGAIWLLTDHPEAMVLRMVPSATSGCPAKNVFFIPAGRGC